MTTLFTNFLWTGSVIVLMLTSLSYGGPAIPLFKNIDNSTILYVREDADVNVTIIILSATDLDDDNMTFFVVSDGGGPFGLDILSQTRSYRTATIKLNVINKTPGLDYETKISYAPVVLSVSDGVRSTNVGITIRVVDVNDNSPILNLTSPVVTIGEDTAVGTRLFYIFATIEKDRIDTDFVSLTGNDSSIFNIEPMTGRIYLNTKVDVDPARPFLVFKPILVVSDGTFTDSGTITLTVLDVNDNNPNCDPPLAYVTVPEETKGNLNILSLNCSDKDSSLNNNNVISYSLVSGNGVNYSVDPFGLVIRRVPCDYETSTSETVLIRVQDGAVNKSLSTTVTVVVLIAPINDNIPTWSPWIPPLPPNNTYTIREDVPVGTLLFTLQATDADLDLGNTLSYNLTSVSDGTTTVSGLLGLDSKIGQVILEKKLNVDGVNGISTYKIICEATDGGGVTHTISREVNLIVSDVNDNAPMFLGTPYSIVIQEENAKTGFVLISVAASDEDFTPSVLTYSVDSVIFGDINVSYLNFSNMKLGHLEWTQDLDLDKGDHISTLVIVKILVKDSGTPQLTGTTTLTMSVIPDNEFTPVIISEPGTNVVKIAENQVQGTDVVHIVAEDEDKGVEGLLQYSIIAGNEDRHFLITSDGTLKTQSILDKETLDMYRLVVNISDSGIQNSRSVITTVTVSVTDINDNAPTCTNEILFLQVPEDATINITLHTFNCSDADSGDALRFVVKPPHNKIFGFKTLSQDLILLSAVDFESEYQHYDVDVIISDGTYNSTVKVNIAVLPVNEDKPMFTTKPRIIVPENSLSSNLVTYTALDTDFSPHNIHSYEITSVSKQGSPYFGIDPKSGTIYLYSYLDFDSLPSLDKSYEIVVVAQDGGGLKGTGTVTVLVSNVNDNPPVCSQPTILVSIPQNQSSIPCSIFTSLGCTDVEDGSALVYSLNQTQDSHFNCTDDAIQLSNKVVDYEISAAYMLLIGVADKGVPTLMSTVVLIVNVMTKNNGGPVFKLPEVVTINETGNIGQFVADVVAIDPDGNDPYFGDINYNIIAGDPANQFYIHLKSGQITIRKRLDFEVNSFYNLVIQAQENLGLNSATVTQMVNINDMNDEAPVCSPDIVLKTVEENRPVNFVVANLSCFDADAGTILEYTIIDGDTSLFMIDKNKLILKSLLDFEKSTSHDLVIQVSDLVPSHNTKIQVTVLVGSVDEGPPVFDKNIYLVSIEENQPIISVVTTVRAVDPDSNADKNGQVIYSLLTNSTQFVICSSSGQISTKEKLDREKIQKYSLIVSASDTQGYNTASILVSVLDVNDNTPIFPQDLYSTSISERDTPGTTLITVSATDADDPDTKGFGRIFYTLSANNLFLINSTTGVITNRGILTKEDMGFSLYLTVTATDSYGQSGALTSTTNVVISLINVNKHAPLFDQSTYSISIKENQQPVGGLILNVTAHDNDTGPDGDMTMQIVGSQTKFFLTQNKNIGEIRLGEIMDFDKGDTRFTFQVIATDHSDTPKSSYCQVEVIILNENDNPPICPSFILVNKQEGGKNIEALNCTDADLGSFLNYSILSSTSINRLRQVQPMVSFTGILTVADPLDFENSPDIKILVKVTDDGLPTLSATVTVSVHVLDINEHDPIFTVNLMFPLREDTPLDGRVLFQVLATGNDGPDDTLTYWILDETYFYISPDRGEIILVGKAPDYETIGDTYNLRVCVKDKPNPTELTSCATIIVNLIDVNDERPTFRSTISMLAIREDATIGTRITGDSAVDKDKSPTYSSISYSIQLGNTENCFKILPNGDLEVIKSLDYERTQNYSLFIQASDGLYNSTTTYNVQITPVNEFVPTFSNSSVTVSIQENSRSGALVYLAEATDLDHGDDGILKYSIEAGLFSINPMSGAITVVGNLDRETTPSYIVKVLTEDMGTPPRTGSLFLTIVLTDVNDNVPACNSNPVFVFVPENISSGDIITKLICYDDDDDPDYLNNKLFYKIVSTNMSAFKINESGEITVIGSLDYESQDLYTVIVQISDQSPILPLTTTVTVSVTVLDINDNTPHFTYLASISVPEDLPVSTTVIMVRAADEDSGANKELLYQINGATVSSKFSIEPIHGNIILEKSLDYEMQKFHQIVVTVRDNGVPPRSVTGTVTVTVTDVNDNPPVCNTSLVTVKLPENSIPQLVASVSCTDVDTTEIVTYSITEGNNSFVIDSNTGAITLAQQANLDFETASLYMLRVSASDGIHIQDAYIKVIVTDVNEYMPVFYPTGPVSKMLPEDLSIYEIIYEFNATDRDISDTVKIYTILKGNSENMFLLDSTSGKLSLESPFHFEDKSTYYLTIEVADSGNFTAEQNITIYVNDTNNNDPSCTSKYVRLSVREGISNILLYAPSCSDKDKVASPFLEYHLNDPSWPLDINKTTGEISLREAFNYENASKLDYQLIVEESSITNPRSTVLLISIHVEPVNEFSPIFQPASTYGTYNIAEDASPGTVITQVLATDADKGLSQGLVRYYIIGGNPMLQFDIDELTGNITLIQRLDYETKTNYSLTIRAEDDAPGSNSSRSATATVRIAVTDVNDHYPTLVPILYKIEIPESAVYQPASIVKHLTVEDADDGMNGLISIIISTGNTGNKFNISGTDLMLVDQLDFEGTTSYELILDIKDGGSPPLRSSGRVVIIVLPINEQAPVMNKSSDFITLPEDTHVGTLVYKVQATDTDSGHDGEITFTITNSSSSSFILDPASGELFVAAELDFDVDPNMLSLTIKATDGGGLSDVMTSILSLTIRLQDTNDNPPLFTFNLYKMVVEENVPLGTVIGSVQATDKDSGIFGQVYYRILGITGQRFLLNNTTGVISTAVLIDYENFKEYSLFVTAFDSGSPALISHTLVKVQVLNKNDNDPEISPVDLVITISELTPPGAIILTYLASDKDTNITGFYLVETTQNFEVVPDTGEVKTLTSLDREIVKEFVLHIKVLDQATANDTTIHTSTATVTILLDDSNDNSPVIHGTYNKSVAENIHINELIFTITATDADEPDNISLIFTIVGGNTENAFHIDSDGHLQVRKSLDRESVALYNLKIRVTDHGIPARSSEATAVIYITDVNDNTPVFQMKYYIFNVSENSFVGTQVGVVNASDPDEGPNAELTYTFDSFSVGQMSHFIIDPATGTISVASNDLDREKLSSYKAKIKVSDAGQPSYRSSFVEAVVNIDDVNDQYPVFTRLNYTIIMDEKTEIDTPILVVVASDLDSDKNADISYIMDTGMMDGSLAKTYFQVNISSGVVSTKNIVSYENFQSFIFLIYVVDHGLPPLTGTTTLTIKIIDINDNYPVFSPTFYNTEMAYNSQCEKVITQVSATDEDFGQNAAISYILKNETSQFLFQLNAATGELGPVNIAPQHARFVLGVLARDAGTPMRSSKVPAIVRVDTFNPDLYVITFKLAISRTAFFARAEMFLNKLERVVQTKFPSAIVRLWCVVEYEGVAHATSGSRRRLLADQPVDVHLYTLRDNTTDSAENINKEKDFLKQDEFLSLVSANPQGDPRSNVQGDEWDYFGIVNVTPYHEEPEGWFDTDYGKAITAVAILLGLVLLAFWSYFLLIGCSACVRGWKRRESVAKKESEEKKFKEKPKNTKFSMWNCSDHSEVREKSVLPSYDGVNETNDTSIGSSQSKSAHSQTDHGPYISQSQHSSLLAYEFRKPVINLQKTKTETASDLSSWKWTIPRLMVVRKNSSDLTDMQEQSTSFEGKAHDRVSGKVYEYNTKTNQREWVN